MDQDLVRFSRAGDTFHYRWAARRCLKLLDPRSGVERVFIEGSEESKLGGECSIDVAEYLEDGRISYFQLKHTTTQMGTPFRFSGLKITLKRFLERFAADQTAPISFHFVTNRPVSGSLKNALSKISEGKGRSSAYFKKLQKLTQIDSGGIERFCMHLNIFDTEGNFRQQKSHLRKESAPYFTSAAESIEMDSLIALVAERALPVPAGKEPMAITKEEVLSQFQIGSEKVLFPADPKFDPVTHPQKREFHDDLLERILRDDIPLVIRASGGVGKTVVAQQLAGDLPHPHRAVVYDCFGNGSYRNPSEPRHPSKVALVQIANELARDGLCSPLIPRPHDGDHALFAAFKDRLIQAITILRQGDPEARLILIIDAADNSEMAAEERQESGFAKLLFREDLPEGCKLVAFSRPGKDRAGLLQPPPICHYYDLPSFTPTESLVHLRSIFPSATSSEGEEFHKLSQENPRVQAFALNEETGDLNLLLAWLGPGNLTVEDIICGQLETAVANLKKKCPEIMQSQITSVCRCLATLPPCIPKEVLASAAKLEASDIDSFVADLGRPLWISENLVYFRDEPTESWFRETFAADIGQISEIVEELMPLSQTSAYLARALPSLLHRSKKFDELLALVLEDRGLPRNVGAAEIKEITIQRTQFAFKAAVKVSRLLDACKLAFKAAEEMAGTKRVDELLQRNADFIGSCAQYDFYVLHARLYLLTALNRAAIDDCGLLEKHLGTLQSQARSGPRHLLIQRTASEICQKIALCNPSLLTSEELKELTLIGHSPYQSPSGFDPIKRSEIILKTLNHLDPESKKPFYISHHLGEDGYDGDDCEKLFEMAMGVDRTARRLLKTLLLVMTMMRTSENTGDYIRLVMPDQLTDDLKAINKLRSEVDSDDFAQLFQSLQQQLHDFGTICIKFGSSEKTR